MLRRIVLMSLCVFVARTAAADTMIAWQSIGEFTSSTFLGHSGTDLVPPVGTNYVLNLSMDPASVRSTIGSPAGSNCNQINVSGSLSFAGYEYGLAGTGYTRARLPGTTCAPGTAETQFLLDFLAPQPTTPWRFFGNDVSFMEVFYADLVDQTGFPMTPIPAGNTRLQVRDYADVYLVVGSGDMQAAPVEQPAPVPEPGTLTLFGLGLAAIARKAVRRG